MNVMNGSKVALVYCWMEAVWTCGCLRLGTSAAVHNCEITLTRSSRGLAIMSVVMASSGYGGSLSNIEREAGDLDLVLMLPVVWGAKSEYGCRK